MLEKIVPQVEFMPKAAVIDQIRRECVDAVVSGELKKTPKAVLKRLDEIAELPDGRHFQSEIVNFVLWINGMPSMYSPPVQAKVYQDPSMMIKFLPYRNYDLKLHGDTVQILPHRNGSPQPLTPDMAQAILRKLPDKQYKKELYLAYKDKACKLMWIDEDGLASIETDRACYTVKPLKEILE